MSANVAGTGEEGDLAEALRELVHPERCVALERERRVLQPSLEDALVPHAHQGRIAAVGYDREPVPPSGK